MDYVYEDDLSGISSQTIYYKLKQVDFNGNFKFSNIKVIQLENNISAKVNVYPNPATTSITIKSDQQSTKSTYRLLNIDGKLIHEGNVFQSNVDVSNLPRGIYFLSILEDGEIIETKSIVLAEF